MDTTKRTSGNLSANLDQPSSEKTVIRPTLKRYIILFLFAINAGNKSFQWIQVSANAKKMAFFFGVDNFVINGTAVLFMLAYTVLSLPACHIIDKLGLRYSVILSSFGAALGSVIKCFSCNESGILMLFVGLTFVSLSEQLIFSLPSRLASVWFPDEEVSTAVSICAFGLHFGVALGFLVPQFFFDGVETKEDIGSGLLHMYQIVALLSVLAFIADFILFDEAPEHAPGLARLKQIEEESYIDPDERLNFTYKMRSLLRQAAQLSKDSSYLLLNFSYSINMGLDYALSTVLDQMLQQIWPNQDMLIGYTGAIVVLASALASPIAGKLMDKWRSYKLINVLFAIGLAVSFAFFGLAVEYVRLPIVVYIAAMLIGIHLCGLLIGGLELAVELTYPAPEVVTATFMNITPQAVGIILTFFASYLVDNHGNLTVTVFFVASTLVAAVCLIFIKENLKRQYAAKSSSPMV